MSSYLHDIKLPSDDNRRSYCIKCNNSESLIREVSAERTSESSLGCYSDIHVSLLKWYFSPSYIKAQEKRKKEKKKKYIYDRNEYVYIINMCQR